MIETEFTLVPNEITSRIAPIDANWAIDAGRAKDYISQIKGIDVIEAHRRQGEVDAALFAEDKPGEPKKPYQVRNGVAVIEISGPMTKKPSSMSFLFGGASTIVIRNQIRSAMIDPEVVAACLVIDSPGGQVAGTADLADDIFAFRKSKPIGCYISDMAASAAYWAASQGTEIWANSTAIVGSIGAYMVVEDYSQMVADMGIKVHVVKSAEFKGAGEPGTEVTDAQLAEFKRPIMSIHRVFVSAIARGRGKEPEDIEGLDDGRVHVGKEAKKLGLVDRIGTLDAFIDHLSKGASSGSPRRAEVTGDISGRQKMAETDDAAVQAAVAQDRKSLKDRILSVLGFGSEDPEGADAVVTATLDPAVKERLDRLEARNLDSLADTFITEAIQGEKIIPAQKDGLRTLFLTLAKDDLADGGKRIDALDSFMENAPKLTLSGEHIQTVLKESGAVILTDLRSSDVSALDAQAASDARAWAEKMNGRADKNGQAKAGASN